MDYDLLKTRFISSSFIIIIFLIFFIYLRDLINLLFICIYLLTFYEVYKNFTRKKIIFFLYIYLILSFLCLQLYIYLYINIYELLFVFLIIANFDTFSYLIGASFGYRKIFKKISPNKSYIGLFGGVFFTIIIVFYINYLFKLLEYDRIIYLIFFYIFLSFCGDVLESLFKRISLIKNSSNFIPGHGGIFDRFDSFIFCTYGLFAYNVIYQ